MVKQKKKKMGRPKKKAKDVRSEIVTTRMTTADHKRLMKDALASGLSISAFLEKCWKNIGRK